MIPGAPQFSTESETDHDARCSGDHAQGGECFVLRDGDSVTLIKDLEVKGGGFTAKRGTLVKGIRLTGNPKNIEGKVNKMQLVLKTEFLKKA